MIIICHLIDSWISTIKLIENQFYNISEDIKHAQLNWVQLIIKHFNMITTNTFLQIFGLVAFIEQKENENNANLCKIHVGLYNASAHSDQRRRIVKANMDFT